jgi:ribosomal subunit interface protein
MQIEVFGRHIEITEDMKDFIGKMVEVALKPFPNVVQSAKVIVSQENYLIETEAIIDLKTQKVLTASSKDKDFRTAVHSLEHKLNEQIRRLKEKIEDHRS